MVSAKKIMGLLLTCMPILALSQKVDNVKIAIPTKDRSIYLLDTVPPPLSEQELFEYVIHPEDSALVRTILEKGSRDEDYLGFFQRKGYRIKRIKLDDFDALPRDNVHFTRRERRVRSELKSLSDKRDSLLDAELHSSIRKPDTVMGPIDSINLKMRDPKYDILYSKESRKNPMFVEVFGIYRYKQYTLVIYYADIHMHELKIHYQIYDTPV
jgi:hypothetical protein